MLSKAVSISHTTNQELIKNNTLIIAESKPIFYSKFDDIFNDSSDTDEKSLKPANKSPNLNILIQHRSGVLFRPAKPTICKTIEEKKLKKKQDKLIRKKFRLKPIEYHKLGCKYIVSSIMVDPKPFKFFVFRDNVLTFDNNDFSLNGCLDITKKIVMTELNKNTKEIVFHFENRFPVDNEMTLSLMK